LRRVAEARKLVPDPLQVDGTPEMPRIKLKMGTVVPPISGKLTLKMPGQSSDTLSNKDGQSSNITINHEPSGPRREIISAEPAVQGVSTPPRARSLRRHVDSPRSSVATTTSEQPTTSLGSRGLSSSIKNEAPMSTSSSQALPNLPFETPADINQHYDLRMLPLPISLVVPVSLII
jgi:chromatin structure-remodeling complex subunit RSC4